MIGICLLMTLSDLMKYLKMIEDLVIDEYKKKMKLDKVTRPSVLDFYFSIGFDNPQNLSAFHNLQLHLASQYIIM